MTEMQLIRALDFFGVAVFAITGAQVAGRRRMDVFGVLVVAVTTAIGGGTLRDLILGVRPFWVSDVAYLYLAVGAGLATFTAARFSTLPARLLLVADALGLGVFTIIGCRKAMEAGCPVAVVLMLGVMTGVMGGIVRDVFCNQIPLILRKEVYATASLAGAALFVFALRMGLAPAVAACIGVVVVIAVRLAAIRFGLALPVFTERGQRENANGEPPEKRSERP